MPCPHQTTYQCPGPNHFISHINLEFISILFSNLRIHHPSSLLLQVSFTTNPHAPLLSPARATRTACTSQSPGTHYPHVMWAHVISRVQVGCERRFNIEFYGADLTVLSLCSRHVISRGALLGSRASTPLKFLLSHTFRETWHTCASISYQFSNDVEFKLAKLLQLIGTIKRTIFRKVRTETILKIYNTLVLPTFLYGSENWTLTDLQRRRIETAEMKLLRPLAGYTLMTTKQRTPYAVNYRLNAY
jgi:hypothetical protein